MRPDMFKVIVERPRLRYPKKCGSAYPRGSLENRWGPDLENSPRRESMGGLYREKWLNENLQPLRRYLRSHVGRPWDEVRSEIAAQIDCGSAVQKHVLDHLRDYVKEHVWFEGSRVKYIHYRVETLLSYGLYDAFYVHPQTRILCRAPAAVRIRRREEAKPDPNRHILSADRELWRIDGVWYAMDLAVIPADFDVRDTCFDVLERRVPEPNPLNASPQATALWRQGRYVARKRQIDTREIARHGLRTAR